LFRFLAPGPLTLFGPFHRSRSPPLFPLIPPLASKILQRFELSSELRPFSPLLPQAEDHILPFRSSSSSFCSRWPFYAQVATFFPPPPPLARPSSSSPFSLVRLELVQHLFFRPSNSLLPGGICPRTDLVLVFMSFFSLLTFLPGKIFGVPVSRKVTVFNAGGSD